MRHEDVYVTLVYTNWQLGTLWSVVSAYSFRAPKGQLQRLTPVMNTTITTLRLSRDWYGGYMYVQKLFTDRMNQSIRNAKAISETITRNGRGDSPDVRRLVPPAAGVAGPDQSEIQRVHPWRQDLQNPFEDRPVEAPQRVQRRLGQCAWRVRAVERGRIQSQCRRQHRMAPDGLEQPLIGLRTASFQS